MDVPRSSSRPPQRRALKLGLVALLLLMTVAVSRIKPGTPRVDASSINTDTVRRGTLVREVRAAGALVPEEVVWISAVSAGRIDRLHVRAGESVKAGTVLLEMTNPDVRLEVLESERELSAAEAALVTLRAGLETQRLNQAGVLAAVRTQEREAARQAKAKAELLQKQIIAPLEAAYSSDQAEELEQRLRIETERLAIVTRAAGAQVAVQNAEIARLRAIVDFQRERHAALTLRARVDAVVQEIPSETGQWVNTGEPLVKLHTGARLKAVLRVPDIEAKDVAPGQSARIDTRNGVVKGSVVRVSPAVQGGIVAVDVALPAVLPPGARPDLSVDGTIEVERVPNALYVARTPDARAFAPLHVYRVLPNSSEAHRSQIKVGRTSTDAMEVAAGLKAGDVIIVSTLETRADRVRLTH